MASVPDSFLEAGLAALKQGNYPTAIAHLETVCQTQVSVPSQVKAQMGLVVAYERSGKISKAIALCQALVNSTNPQVREWATKNITALTNRHPSSIKNDSTSPPASTASELDNTGFVAFNRPPQQSRPVVAPPAPPTPPTSSQRAGRAKRWQPLTSVNLVPLWLLQAGCAIALFWLLKELLKFVMDFTNDLLVKLPYLEPFQPFYRDPSQFVLLTLGILMSLSPWLLDGLLRLQDGLQPLSMNTLSNHSPEAIRVLQSYCRKRRWPYPTLGILPISAPMALTYGNLPRTARIVVTQGLLEQLADDEIATIYAVQLGHIANWDFVVMSLLISALQLPYTVYRQVSQWGDGMSNLSLRLIAAAISSIGYAIWYLLSRSTLWISQLRIYYSDRFAAEVTGNPNGLTRALLKIAQGIAKDIQQQGHTSWLLESLNVLTPVGYCQAITFARLDTRTQLEPVLAWDLNPYRYWLAINNSHPLMGDRLQRLARIAQYWHLETELNLVNSPSVPAFPAFLLQGAPFFGITLGFALGCLTWLIGGIGILLHIAQLAWMYGDWVLIKGFLPIGFSIGTFLRINSFFPDIKPNTVPERDSLPSLVNLLANPNALPIDSQPVRLQGKLLGRRGISNWLGQDLILRSPTGLVKLHHQSPVGPIGNLLPQSLPLVRDLVGQNLIATGWFRRGATPWIDIDKLQTQRGKISYSSHPVWSTLLASAAAAWGAYIILS